MNEKRITAKKQYAGEKRASMKRRADRHNYNDRRMYLITIEAAGRQPLFGHIVGDVAAAPGSEDAPRIELSALGQAVQSEWFGIHGYYPQIEVMALQMMPDHLHGILFVRAPLPVHLGQVISGFKAGCRKKQRALATAAAKPHLTEKAPTHPQSPPSPLPSPNPQSPPSPLPSSNPQSPPSPQATALPLLFEKGYNDLILRSYDELPVWQNYLRDNPRRLLLKRTYPDWLRPYFGLRIAGQTYSAIGNRALLSAPQRLFVRVSRRLTASEIDVTVHRYLNAAQQGAVLVSPAISPGEKRVMRAAFDAGLPTIVLMENGFTPLSKPHGEQFYACAQGRLLMLSPWEHHNEKRKITAEQCKQLNLMALDICALASPAP